MKIDKNLLKLLRNKTQISLTECVKALEKSKNNYFLAKQFLLNKDIFDIKNKKNLNYIIYIYRYNKLCILIKCKIESNLLIKNKYLIYIIKKIIFTLILKKYKNISLLMKNNFLNINNIINSFIIKTKENFCVNKFNILKFKNNQITYNYNNKICLIIIYNKYSNIFLTKNICIHILISKPIFISLKSIKIKLIFNKYKILKNTKKILLNKILIKLFKSYTLINQYYIKNDKYKIKNILLKKKIIINTFLIYK